MAWHVYEIAPIDHGWHNLKPVSTWAGELAQQQFSAAAHDPNDGISYGEDPLVQEFLDRWESAKSAASSAGWEGDFRQEPVIFWLPGGSDFDYGFVIKQDNNGTTYVVSPVELPHLNN